LVFDRGYWDYGWLMGLDKKWIYFVTRPRKNTDYIVIESKTIGISWVQTEEIVEIFNPLWKTTYQWKLRRIHYISPDDWKEYWFITNNFETDAKYITLLYKKRWEIEIFFKFIKQTLKIKSFLGTSKNAIMNQLWVAMIYYLILCYIKFKTKVKQWLLELSRVFAAGIFIRRKIIDLLGLMPKNIPKLSQRMKRDVFVQLGLF
jgi:IS4 transposase